MGTVTTETAGTLALNGRVHGGIQPIAGATIQLFAVGTTGNGSPATSLLNTPVVTDSKSLFTLTGDYSCPSASSQVYLVARGGNPGFSGAVNNNALVLLSALGSCGNLIANPNRFISVNEVSTVAAVYALAPFMTAYDHVGASSTNSVGITNAFLNAQLLANTATGRAATLPANITTEPGKLYALADAIVPCVNSDGGTACSPLFSATTPASGGAPTDVVTALLNVVKNPGRNVTAVFNTIGSTPPYPTTLTAAPHDWTMSVSMSGGGLNTPTAMGLDLYGNVWVANYGTSAATSGLVAFSPQGTPLAGSPFGVGVQTESYGLALDRNSDIWVVSKEANSNGGTGSVAKFHGAASGSPGTLIHTYADSTLFFPQSVATDPSGNGTVIIGNYSGPSYVGGSATIYDLNGNFIRNFGTIGGGKPSFPVGVISDGNGGVWFADQGDHTVEHAFSNGSTQLVTCCNAAQTVALDPFGDLWVTNFTAVGTSYTYSEVAANGSVLLYEASTSSLKSPGGAAIDAAGQFWIANYNGASITEVAGNSNAAAAGTVLSPSGFGQDAALKQPFSLAIDQSGNVWVTNQAKNTLAFFVGLATPTAAPARPLPQAP